LGALVIAAMSVSMKLACTATTRVLWWCSSRRMPLVKDHSAASETPVEVAGYHPDVAVAGGCGR